MAENTTDISGKLFELGMDNYRTFLKSLIWGQERALDFSRDLLSRSVNLQKEGMGLLEEYGENLRRGQKIVQEAINGSVRATSEALQQYRDTTQENLNTLRERMDAVQARIQENPPVMPTIPTIQHSNN